MELPNSNTLSSRDPDGLSSFIGRPWVIALILVILSLLAFAPVWKADFLTYDDPAYVTGNENIQQGMSVSALKWAFTTGHASNWHPVTWISHMIDWQLFGNNPTGHHAVNLILHIGNVLLLFILLYQITGGLWRSAIVAAIFAVHPTHVESVAWVAERKDVLSTCFGLLTLLAYVRYAAAPAGKRGRYYFAALMLFGLGLMSKPMLVTLPFVFLLLDYWPLRRFSGLSEEARYLPSSLKAIVLEKAPFLGLAILACALTIWAQSSEAIVSTDKLSIFNRFTTAIVSYVRYIGKFFWPTDLAAYYPHPGTWPWWSVAGSVLILGPLSWGFVQIRRTHPYLLIGWLWFLGTLVPVIGLVQVGGQSLADRYLYLPSIGLTVAAVWFAADVIGRFKSQNTFVVLCITAGVLSISTVLTFQQTTYWTNSIRLFRHALRVTDNNVVAHNHLGAALMMRGELEEADFHFKRALELDKADFYSHANLGRVLMQKGHAAKAVPHYEAAVAANADDPEARTSLGEALLHDSKLAEAAEQFEAALKTEPNNVRAKVGYAHSLLARGRFADAETVYRQVIEQTPGDRGAAFGLASVLLSLGRTDEARKQMEAASEGLSRVQMKAQFAVLLSQAGKFGEAAEEYRQALNVEEDVGILNNFAWLLATCGDAQVRNGKEAVRYAEKACLLTRFEVPVFIGTLAAAYAEAGDFTKAVETGERAQAVALSKGQPEIAAKNAELLKLYRENRPYHDAPPNGANAGVTRP